VEEFGERIGDETERKDLEEFGERIGDETERKDLREVEFG
jgi:hypothetical protein